MEAGQANAGLADVILAARLFLNNPHTFGGIVLRGSGPVRDRLLAQMAEQLAQRGPVIRIPINVDSEQLLGGLDLTETLAKGTAVRRAGLLEQARGGVVLVPMAERVSANVAAHLAQAMDSGEIAVIALDDGIESDEVPPGVLLERAAFHCDLTAIRDLDFVLHGRRNRDTQGKALTMSQRKAISATAAAVGVHSVRPMVMTEKAARHFAQLASAETVGDDTLQAAIRVVIGPRARQLPEAHEPPPPAEEPRQPGNDSEPTDDDKNLDDISLDDLLLEAAEAAIPQYILDGISKGTVRASGGRSGKSGQKEKSTRRGRPRGSHPGVPGDGCKLALIDTLRAAAPWQTIRRKEAGDDGLHIRKSDLRIRRFEQNRETLTIFAVDASGSSALSRLAEAKGAVELMLAEAHVKRSQVALIAFRQTGAEILLPPTRSLTRARRALSAFPGGGGTPLAAGLLEARLLADAAEKRGQTPTIALLTDGKANVTLAGEADRTIAAKEVADVAKGIAAAGHHSIVIDISPRPREEAAELAAALLGKYLALPRAKSAAMVEAIDSIGTGADA
ncbi:VWA domain-containing protein [Altererythrobacter aestiaquae]|uniref:VWA domain-containing protein n=1 Tax=Pontixanthobacter aestiaquae TaxID=1509367 RepID=A0A844ZB37_9SPHN|nr:VWA domain-containing protein [Pontixanthobacter aestiaquae]